LRYSVWELLLLWWQRRISNTEGQDRPLADDADANLTGLPQQWAAVVKNGKTINYKSCVRAKDLTTNPWTDGDDSKCGWTVLKSDGTDMEIKATSCELGKEWGMITEGIGKIHVVDSENGTGSVDMTITGNGQTIKGHSAYTGKWIGASCPAH
jgi:hypothetical protein